MSLILGTEIKHKTFFKKYNMLPKSNELKVGWYMALIATCIIVVACEDWDLQLANFPKVSTLADIKAGNNPTEIVVFGNIGGLLNQVSVSEHGHLWSSTIDQPTLDDQVNTWPLKQRSNGDFESLVQDLTPGQTIFYRAYAIFEQKVIYGEVRSYTPEDFLFEISTDSVTSIYREGILSEVIIQNSIKNLPLKVPIAELGLLWAQHPEPKINDELILEDVNIANSDANLAFQSTLSNVPPGSYYARSYLVIGERTYYGNTLCFSIGDFWVQMRNFPDFPRPAGLSFGLYNFGFFGGGGFPSSSALSRGLFKDFWRYDPANNNWLPAANVPFTMGRPKAITLKNKGYFGFGFTSAFGPEYWDVLWEYDPEKDLWTEQARFPGGERAEVIAFATNDFIYVGTGVDQGPVPNSHDDFWQFDPASNQWEPKAAFPGGPRWGGESFAIDDRGYLLDSDEFWEYNPATDTWSSKNYPPELTILPSFLFVANGKAYLEGQGFWEYDPIQNNWTLRAPLPTANSSAHFSINKVGYIGVSGFQAFWAYYPLVECE